MLDDLNNSEQQKQVASLLAVLLAKSGGKARVTKAELEACEGKIVRVEPAGLRDDEWFVSLEKESE